MPITAINPNQYQDQIQQFVCYLQSKRYSENTIRSYSNAVLVFLNHIRKCKLSDIDHHDVIHFNRTYIFARKYSISYQNQVINAM